MESHISNSLVALWKIMGHGFNPVDVGNLTPHEVIDQELNATAIHLI